MNPTLEELILKGYTITKNGAEIYSFTKPRSMGVLKFQVFKRFPYSTALKKTENYAVNNDDYCETFYSIKDAILKFKELVKV